MGTAGLLWTPQGLAYGSNGPIYKGSGSSCRCCRGSCQCGSGSIGSWVVGGNYSNHLKVTFSGFPVLDDSCRNYGYQYPNGFDVNGTYCVPNTNTLGEFTCDGGASVYGPSCLYQLQVTGSQYTIETFNANGTFNCCNTLYDSSDTWTISILAFIGAVYIEAGFNVSFPFPDAFAPLIIGAPDVCPPVIYLDCGQTGSATCDGSTYPTGGIYGGDGTSSVASWAFQYSPCSRAGGFTAWGGTVSVEDGGC